MPLTIEQKQFIETLDTEVKELLEKDGFEKALFLLLGDNLDEIGRIIDSTSHDEINAYCKQYSGFHRLMALIAYSSESCQ